MRQPVIMLSWIGLAVLVGCLAAPPEPAARTSDSASLPAATTAATQATSQAAAGDETGDAAAEKQYVFTTGAVYYSGDPTRGHTADGTIRRGTKAVVIRRSGGYMLVETENGTRGYVAANTLVPASALANR